MEVKGVRDVPVGVIVWSMVETAVTLVCVGIPVCRPLWTRHFSKYFKSKNSSYQEQPDGVAGESPIGLNTFGGGDMPGAHESGSNGSSEKKGRRNVSGNKRRGPLSSLFASLAATTVARDRTTVKDRTTASDSRSDEVELTEESGVIIDSKAFGGDGEAPGSSGRPLPTAAANDDRTPSHDGGRDDLKRSWIMGERGTMTRINGEGDAGAAAAGPESSEDGIVTHMSYEIRRSRQ